MFVEQKQLIEVVIYHRMSKSGNSIKVETNPSKIKDDEQKLFTKSTFKMRPMTWKFYNDLLRESKVNNIMTQSEDTDWATYREKKLVKLLAEWDAKDKDGNPVPLTHDKIMSLHPLVAENVLNEYDRKVYMDEDEQKN